MRFVVLIFIFFQLQTRGQITLNWQKTFGGGHFDIGYKVLATLDGGCIIVGMALSSESGDVDATHGGGDAWVVKLDAQQNIQWQRALGGTGLDELHAILPIDSGGYILTGLSYSNDEDLPSNYGDKDVWVIRLDDTGAILWSKNFGGSSADQGYSITQVTDGNFVIAATSSSTDFDLPSSTKFFDWWIIKLTSNGEIIWKKTFGGSQYEIAYDVTSTTDGGVAIIGITESLDGDVFGQHGSGDYWVLKLDSIGHIQWQKALGGEYYENGQNIKQCPDGGYIITGYSSSNNSGDVGQGHGSYDAWVVKLTDSGDLEWQKAIGGNDDDWLVSISLTHDGGYLLTGTTFSTNGDVIDNDGVMDIWIVKITASGKLLESKTFGGTNAEWASAITQTADGGFLVIGDTQSQDGDVSSNHGLKDIWLLNIQDGITGIHPLHSISMPLHPTPAHQSITIDWPEQSIDLQYSIFDSNGRAVQQGRFTTGTPLNVADLKSGIFYIQVIDDGGKAAGNKFIKH